MRPLLILLLMGLCIPIHLYSQKAPIKFGKVTDEELMMTVYDPDTSASAVILCDYGQFLGDEFRFIRNTRIKILKNSGLHFGSMAYVTAGMPGVRGITFNVIDGVSVKSKLKKSDILIEQLRTGIYEVNVPMPEVKVGSVIEIEMTFTGLPLEWRFQDNIPVKYSEIRLKPSKIIKFNRNFYGFESLSFQDGRRFIATNMPAFKKEGMITSVDNYLTRFEFELEEINLPGYFESIASSWSAVNKQLLGSQYFPEPTDVALCLNAVANDIREKATTSEERLKMAYDTIKTIKWNEKLSLLTTESGICSAFKDKVGNSADINLSLMLLLNKLDFEVTPVALSTRSNGLLPVFKPSLNKLNYVIVSVNMGDEVLLLDATEQYLPYKLLPERCLNLRGRTISNLKSDWVPLNPGRSSKSISLYDLRLNEDMSMTGTLQKRMFDYAAFNTRKAYHKSNSQTEYIDSYMADNSGLRVSSYAVNDLDNIYLPLSEEMEITIKGFAESFGDELLITPMLFERLEENPFKLEVRKYPVDYGYCIDNSLTIIIKIPDNYAVYEIPEPLILKTSDEGISCLYTISVSGNTITTTYKYNVNKTVFLEDEYGSLKEIHNQIMKKHAEPIILKKTL